MANELMSSIEQSNLRHEYRLHGELIATMSYETARDIVKSILDNIVRMHRENTQTHPPRWRGLHHSTELTIHWIKH